MAFAGLLLCGVVLCQDRWAATAVGNTMLTACPMPARCLLRVIHRPESLRFGVGFCARSLMLSACTDAFG